MEKTEVYLQIENRTGRIDIAVRYSWLQTTLALLQVAFAEEIYLGSIMLTLFHFSLLFTPPSDISHFQEQNDLKGLLENLHQNIQAKKRKNVEIMWLAATVSTHVKSHFPPQHALSVIY